MITKAQLTDRLQTAIVSIQALSDEVDLTPIDNCVSELEIAIDELCESFEELDNPEEDEEEEEEDED